MWMRGEEVLLDEALADDDGVLVVAALPGHERDQHVLAERQLAVLGRAGVGERVVLLHALAHVDDRTLVDARALVRADELLKQVLVELACVGLDLNSIGGHAA